MKFSDLLLEYKVVFLVILVLGLFLDVFIFDFHADPVTLFFTLLWVGVISLYNFSGKVSVGIGLFFLAFCPFLMLFGAEFKAEKSAIWAYMFLLVCVVQELIRTYTDPSEFRAN